MLFGEVLLMETEQTTPTKKRTTDLFEQFSKQKAEDPLIRYWIERKRGIPDQHTLSQKKSQRHRNK